MPRTPKLDRHYEWARLAAALAADYRSEEVRAPDVLRVLRHELRTLNTNKAIATPADLWSVRATEVYEEHKARGERVPPNGFAESLHCDHLYGVRAEDLDRYTSIENWLGEVPRLCAVVVVTARENYRLQRVEGREWDGPPKYAAADVPLVNVTAVRALFLGHPGSSGISITA